MNILTINSYKNYSFYVHEVNDIKQKVFRIARNALDYFVRNQFALTISIWSFTSIQMVSALEEFQLGERYVYDIDTCRDLLCEYSNNYTRDHGDRVPIYDVTCNSSLINYDSFYDCLDDLCRYTNRIGQRFYACHIKHKNYHTELYDFTNQEMWNNICPKHYLGHITSFKQLGYLNRCMKKICKIANNLTDLDISFTVLCENTALNKLHKVLHQVKKSSTKLRNTIQVGESLTHTSIITGILSGLGSIVSAAATIGGLFTIHRVTEQAMHEMAPVLAENIKSLSDTTTQSAIAIVSGSLSQTADLIPETSVKVLNELHTFLEDSVGKAASEVIEIIETTV